MLSWALGRSEPFELAIFDVAGRLVRSLRPDSPAASGGFFFDGRDASGGRLAAGTYFYRLRTESGGEARGKVVLR